MGKKSKYRKIMPRDRDNTYRTISIHEMHLDYSWCQEKINGHGGSVHYNSLQGLAQIGYIGSTGRFKIAYYNIILWFRWQVRKAKNYWEMVTNVYTNR